MYHEIDSHYRWTFRTRGLYKCSSVIFWNKTIQGTDSSCLSSRLQIMNFHNFLHVFPGNMAIWKYVQGLYEEDIWAVKSFFWDSFIINWWKVIKSIVDTSAFVNLGKRSETVTRGENLFFSVGKLIRSKFWANKWPKIGIFCLFWQECLLETSVVPGGEGGLSLNPNIFLAQQQK